MSSSQAWAEILAPLVGVLLTIVYRLVDHFIPDETGSHPLPATPSAAYANERSLLMPISLPTPDPLPIDEDTQPTVNDPTTVPDAEPVQDSGRTLADDGDPAAVDDAGPEEGADEEHDPEERS